MADNVDPSDASSAARPGISGAIDAAKSWLGSNESAPENQYARSVSITVEVDCWDH